MAIKGHSDIACLTLNIWHEARGEGVAGMAVVAQNVVARIESSNYADTACGVVFETMSGGSPAYSWTQDELGDQIILRNKKDLRALQNALLVAEAFLNKEEPVRFAGLENGVLYHADGICPPFCSSPYTMPLAQVGGHIVYAESRSRPLR